MAGVVPTSFQIPNPSLPSTLNSSPLTTRRRKLLPLAPHALADDPKPDQDSSSSSAAPAEPPASATADPTFENRLARVRLKYRSGTGKKAEQRRARKSGGGGGGGKKKVMLPPVPLKEAVAAGGLPVEMGFSPYSERLNGRLAGLGLAALLLVELASGQSLLRYHSPPILFIQLYSIAAAAALFIKFEKECISVWPSKPSPSRLSSTGFFCTQPPTNVRPPRSPRRTRQERPRTSPRSQPRPLPHLRPLLSSPATSPWRCEI